MAAQGDTVAYFASREEVKAFVESIPPKALKDLMCLGIRRKYRGKVEDRILDSPFLSAVRACSIKKYERKQQEEMGRTLTQEINDLEQRIKSAKNLDYKKKYDDLKIENMQLRDMCQRQDNQIRELSAAIKNVSEQRKNRSPSPPLMDLSKEALDEYLVNQ